MLAINHVETDLVLVLKDCRVRDELALELDFVESVTTQTRKVKDENAFQTDHFRIIKQLNFPGRFVSLASILSNRNVDKYVY